MNKINYLIVCFSLFIFADYLQAAEIPFIELKGHTQPVYSAAFSPDGKRVVTGSFDGTARIWDTGTGKVLRTLDIGMLVYFVAFSPDGKQILVACGESNLDLKFTTFILDAESGGLLKMFEGHTDAVNSAAFSPDGKRIVTASRDKTARIWNVETRRVLQTLRHPEHVNSVAFSPDGKMILTACNDKTANLWDAETVRLVRAFERDTTAVQASNLSQDNQRRLAAGLTRAAQINSAAFSPNGKEIVAGSNDGFVQVWDADTGRVLRTMEPIFFPISSVVYSTDGKGTQILAAWGDKTIGDAGIFDAGSGKLIREFSGHKGMIWSASFSPDGKKIVTASQDETVRIWTLP